MAKNAVRNQDCEDDDMEEFLEEGYAS